MAGLTAAETGRVRRRRVFYIPGFDPLQTRRYRQFYRTEGPRQAAISGYALEVGRKPAGMAHGWSVASQIDGETVEAVVEVLAWADIIGGSMRRTLAATYGQMVRTAWIYVASGALFRLGRLRKGPTLAALYPVVMLSMQAVVAGLAGWGLGAAVAGLVPGWGGAGLGLLAGGAVVGLVLRAFRRWDRWFLAHYLMHDYAFSAGHRGAYPPALVTRMEAFRARIAVALAEDWDEVLVVGHSSGAILGVTILADLIREGLPARGPALGFLTLGQVVPMVSFLPEARKLRGDLAYLSTREELAWVDVSAPGDGCAFALCDAVAVSGVAPSGKRWPLVLSCAFTQTFSPERWRKMRFRWFRLHFQYMCAFDRPGDYDYFRVTAGPLTLRARYAGRAASKSRIERALSGHRSVA
ncbi:hypothetical protein GU927_002190 [Rhodobacteraceae bacterium HSP-20]|uniref:Fungal lipase-like domain-containing protein n=1 Tax=Paragemmobacter amnigenus TaxID=2852097 RepID=A0ABS6IZ70_9RHOB|nr:hypothetical protein [Rhodobacter amnigenus]MBU9696648.1 hypothetical protein [Rhodobacter amnigenus]MBV4387875.1 hypothetical protein [Rhodobacter amnigenus]